jgi:1-acyl-sn-glycerol-3-phosphate acyltransferase
MKLIQAVRTALFYLLFIGQTAVVAIIIGTLALIRGRTKLGWALAVYWCRSSLVILRALTGVRTEVTGAEHIPPGGCIIASKHQSDWDVFAIFPYTGRPAYVIKKELMNIPFFGWAARAMDCIEVDRKRGAEAIPLMMAQAHAARLPPDVFMQRLKKAIETDSDALILEAAEQGLARPMDGEFRAKLEDLKAGQQNAD